MEEQDQVPVDRGLMSAAVVQMVSALEAALDVEGEKVGIVGLPTGVMSLDESLGGLFDGDLVVIGGRPGTFKTPIALSMFHHAASLSSGERVPLFFSLEASVVVACQRLAAQRGPALVSEIRRGLVPDKAWDGLSNVVDSLGKKLGAIARLFDDCFDVAAIRREVEYLAGTGVRPSAIFVDYVQLLRGSARQVMTRADELGFISRELKLLGREYQCPVVAVSQVTRGVEERPSKQAVPSDLRGAGSLEEDADVVLLLRRLSTSDEVAAVGGRDLVDIEVLVAKHKYGRTGDATVLSVHPASGFFHQSV